MSPCEWVSDPAFFFLVRSYHDLFFFKCFHVIAFFRNQALSPPTPPVHVVTTWVRVLVVSYLYSGKSLCATLFTRGVPFISSQLFLTLGFRRSKKLCFSINRWFYGMNNALPGYVDIYVWWYRRRAAARSQPNTSSVAAAFCCFVCRLVELETV